jgi:hypothetical protein
LQPLDADERAEAAAKAKAIADAAAATGALLGESEGLWNEAGPWPETYVLSPWTPMAMLLCCTRVMLPPSFASVGFFTWALRCAPCAVLFALRALVTPRVSFVIEPFFPGPRTLCSGTVWA